MIFAILNAVAAAAIALNDDKITVVTLLSRSTATACCGKF